MSAPWAASARQIAAPIPCRRLAPVTTATRPVRSVGKRAGDGWLIAMKAPPAPPGGGEPVVPARRRAALGRRRTPEQRPDPAQVLRVVLVGVPDDPADDRGAGLLAGL